MTEFVLAPGRLPDGERVYAIGDVHGCDRKLAALHERIAEHAAGAPAARITIVHLGDYVDRGPDSAAVVERIARPPPVGGAKVVNLIGNHEEMMLAALTGDPASVNLWRLNKGEASLRSWGADPGASPAEWARAVPPRHRATLEGLSLMHRAGEYLFVHAGIRPLVPIERQDRFDLLWIREPFLSWDEPFGCVVVHGHTPMIDPVVRANRIGIDTGAVIGGPLTCAILEGDRVAFLTA